MHVTLFIRIAETANTENDNNNDDVSFEDQKNMPAYAARGK